MNTAVLYVNMLGNKFLKTLCDGDLGCGQMGN